MSKYNLIDIYEQYQIGSGWTTDFDYDGMLMAGLKAGVDTDIEILKKMSDDFEDVNYHRENNHLQNAIEALEDGATKEAAMFFGDFHAEIKQTIKDQGMDIEPTVGQFMASKMEEGEEVTETEEVEEVFL
jgi:gas vesicle protein